MKMKDKGILLFGYTNVTETYKLNVLECGGWLLTDGEEVGTRS
jgi:hypothetical protein